VFEFEWDEAKRLSNIEKHGIDFQVAQDVFDGRPMYLTMGLPEGEIRFTSIALLDGRFVAAIWTVRGSKIRFISVRGTRHAERRKFRQLHV
jgi:uncharacterized DUF497 family protein